MPDIAGRDSWLLRIQDYWKRKSLEGHASSRIESYEMRQTRSSVTTWDYYVGNCTAQHVFVPGTVDVPLRGRCSMLKVKVNENAETLKASLTVFGRTDLVAQNSQEITHANWRRDLSLPFDIKPKQVRLSNQNGAITVELDFQ